jgi:hypothetical protein
VENEYNIELREIFCHTNKMSFSNCYDGGSVEIGPSSPLDSSNSDSRAGDEDSAYVYVKYRIANKLLSSMEDQIFEMRTIIDSYAAALQNETQFREACQQALYDEQVRHGACRAAYSRLSKSFHSQTPRSDQEPTACKAQIWELLTLVAQLQKKIRTMTEQHSSALSIAADRIVKTESALERMQVKEQELRCTVSNL